MFWQKTLKPVKQLEVVLHEVEREILVTQTRTESMRVRASVLIGASGLLTAAPDKWQSPWQIISLAMGLAAAGFGLAALIPSNIVLADMRENLHDRLRLQPYDATYNVYTGLANELGSIRNLSEKISMRLRFGYVFLVLSWFASATILFLKSLSLV